jgi:predicted hotdog family 3-hydroxylacyl-ACP dehydratase
MRSRFRIKREDIQLSIDKGAICNMLPHGESMCLLDKVESWDEKRIICLTKSHQLATNPLRNAQGLPMITLMEYGAQAMAIHGCLLMQQTGTHMQEGYLAGLRDVKLAEGYLSDIDEELVIEAEQVYKDGGNMIYNLSIKAGVRELASGRATAVGKLNQESDK